MRFAIFDCDGTLVDSQYVIAEAMNLTFAEIGLPELPTEEVRTVIGLKLPEAIATLLGTPPPGRTGRI